MLTTVLLLILGTIVGLGLMVGPQSLFKKIACLIPAVWASAILAPLILSVISRPLSAVLPVIFIRIILLLALIIGFNYLMHKLWHLVASKISNNNDNLISEPPKKQYIILHSLLNAGLGCLIFLFLLLGYATTVDVKVMPPIVSSEVWYQTTANGLSTVIFGKAPSTNYIVTKKKQKQKLQQPQTHKYARNTDYDNIKTPQNRSNASQSTAPSSQSINKNTPNRSRSPSQVADAEERPQPFVFPDINLKDEDVQALQEIVNDEVKNLLNESPDELKRALSDVLTEEKGAELSSYIDDHIRSGRSLDHLMNKIENIMGDPDNLSAEFKEALPDLLKEMELTDD
ncbi:MAG: hypothetical protein OXE99_02715 [Cellvibrionales bacterium]|nr:hypothetical protein [Cellvibrionales bacterium]